MKLAWLLWLASILPGHGQDQVCLATTVYLEARDQPVMGQTAVAEVVLRRRDSGRYGNGVCGVVMQHKQFAPAFTSGQFRIRSFKAWTRAWQVAADTIAMWSLPASVRKQVAPGADHFYAHNIVQPQWGGTTVAVIGGHSFVRVGL